MSRKDLSNWIIHFVHRRNPENDPLEFSYDFEDLEYIPFPDSFTYEGEPIFLTEKYEEDDYPLEPDAYAFGVLKKILHDGIIKTGWSYRKGNPTIYGPKSAACFTEMPLYALIEYAKNRRDENSIEPYGIAFLKPELFEAGARPVIYGLSGKHQEAKETDANFGIGLRSLSTECGIGLREMYRYVYTNINSQRLIDWTHEREWRWADLDKRFEFPGLPFIAENESFTFSKIIVIVKTKEEAEDIIDHLQNLYHSKSTNFERMYDLKVISNTAVLAIEDLAGMEFDLESVKLDDLPISTIPQIQKIEVRPETYELVKKAIEEAGKIAYQESEKKFKEIGDVGPCGWYKIITYESNSEITQALIDLEIAHSYGKGDYTLYGIKSYPAQDIAVSEPGSEAAAKYLTEVLGQPFYTEIRWD